MNFSLYVSYTVCVCVCVFVCVDPPLEMFCVYRTIVGIVTLFFGGGGSSDLGTSPCLLFSLFVVFLLKMVFNYILLFTALSFHYLSLEACRQG